MVLTASCWRWTLGADELPAGQTDQPRHVRAVTETDCGVSQTDEPVVPGEADPQVGPGALLAEELLTCLCNH